MYWTLSIRAHTVEVVSTLSIIAIVEETIRTSITTTPRVNPTCRLSKLDLHPFIGDAMVTHANDTLDLAKRLDCVAADARQGFSHASWWCGLSANGRRGLAQEPGCRA
jgi:hypothetical protein